jgi:hypothetical protein
MPLQATTGTSTHIRGWGQINLPNLIIVVIFKLIGNIIIGARLPSVAIVPALNIFFPLLTESAALIIQVVLIEEHAVTAGTPLGDIIGGGGPVIIRQVTSRAFTLERGTLRLSNRKTLVYRILFRHVATHDLTVILHGSPTITPLSGVTNEIRH